MISFNLIRKVAYWSIIPTYPTDFAGRLPNFGLSYHLPNDFIKLPIFLVSSNKPVYDQLNGYFVVQSAIEAMYGVGFYH